MRAPLRSLAAVAVAATGAAASIIPRQSTGAAADSCPGYKASNVLTSYGGSTLTATLSLAGTACNAYGDDLTDLTLTVEYQTGMVTSTYPRIKELKLTQGRHSPTRPNPGRLVHRLPGTRVCSRPP